MTKAIIRRGRERTEIDILYSDGILTAVYPFYGPANAKTLREQIRQDNLQEPTSKELAIFAEAMYGGGEREEQEVTETMRENYFRGFTGILYVPKTQLAHFIDYPEFDENSEIDTQNLLLRLRDSYAQVPFKYIRPGVIEWTQVAKHPYIQAWAHGEEGAERLAELTSKHPAKTTYICVPNLSNMKEPEARLASLGSYWHDYGLGVRGLVGGDSGYDYAFGVRREGARAGGVAQKI